MYQVISKDLTKEVHHQIKQVKNSILLAAPFLSDYIKDILTPITPGPEDRRIITRFDQNHITTFHLDAMNFLLDQNATGNKGDIKRWKQRYIDKAEIKLKQMQLI